MFIFKTYKPYFYINPKLFITITFNETSSRSSMFPSDRHFLAYIQCNSIWRPLIFEEYVF